jgi:hypothetical protein
MNCESGGIRAIPICSIPSDTYIKYAELLERFDNNIFSKYFALHAHLGVLEELGGKIISDKDQRIVEFDGVQFKEGEMQAQINHISNMYINKDMN